MMNELLPSDQPRGPEVNAPLDEVTRGTSSLYRLFEAFIGLRERNERQHKMFEQTLVKTRDSLQASFNNFAADTQRAYQHLRQEIQGEKRVSLALLTEFMDLGLEMEQIVAARPRLSAGAFAPEEMDRWADAVEVQYRMVGAALIRHGIHRYDAAIGSPYNPALHERAGSRRVEGMDGQRIAEQTQHGFASQQPEFVLRRPKVIVTE